MRREVAPVLLICLLGATWAAVAIGASVFQGYRPRTATPPAAPERAAGAPTWVAMPMLPDVGFVNVKTDCGAKGDGGADDTGALLSVIGTGKDPKLGGTKHPTFGVVREIYLPPGVYLVSRPLVVGGKKKWIQGAGVGKTVIRLKDNCPGFQDPSKPQVLLDTKGKVFGAQNFGVEVHDLTIDVGRGNAGAVGLHFHTNNGGTCGNVVIRSSDPQGRGAVGLAMNQWAPGPGLVKNLLVEGFDKGVFISHDQYSMVFEHLILKGQREVGFENAGNTVSIRDLRSTNAVPAVRNRGSSALMCLVEGELTGGAGGAAAIENSNDGGLFARDVTTAGYGAAIRSDAAGGKQVKGPDVEEFSSHPVLGLFDSPTKSLRLPIEDPPNLPYGDVDDWTSPLDHGAKGDGKTDDTAAVQKAMDSGSDTVFIPGGRQFLVTDTLIVRGALQRLIGYKSMLTVRVGEAPAFRIEDGTSPVVVLERVSGTPYRTQCGVWIEHASKRTLVCVGVYSYRNTVPGGKVFMEDGCALPLVFDRQKVWIRHVNTESYEINPHIVNRGGDLWILGIKTEKDRTIIGTYDGGRTELLGGLLYKNRQRVGQAPCFINHESSHSLVYRAKGVPYDVHVEETRGGQKRTLPKEKTHRWRSTLYVGYKGK
jgi:hypothetical protein